MHLKLSKSIVVATDLPADAVKSFKTGDKITSGANWIQITDVSVSLPSTGPVVAIKYMMQLDGQRTSGNVSLSDFITLTNEKMGAKLALPRAAKVK